MPKAQQTELVAADSKAEIAASDAQSPADLLRIVAQRGATPEEVAKWMDLEERWRANKARAEFAQAMSRLQASLPRIEKRREVKDRGGRTLYKFANCDDVSVSIKAIEQLCGFYHRFDFAPLAGGGCVTTCTVTHVAGHSESTTVTVPATSGQLTNAAQNRGIEMQYGMRYSLLGAYGITTADEDTDGRTDEASQTVSLEEAAKLRELCETAGRRVEDMCKWAGCADIEQFPTAKLDEAVAILAKAVRR
jgi:hypothetical protein